MTTPGVLHPGKLSPKRGFVPALGQQGSGIEVDLSPRHCGRPLRKFRRQRLLQWRQYSRVPHQMLRRRRRDPSAVCSSRIAALRLLVQATSVLAKTTAKPHDLFVDCGYSRQTQSAVVPETDFLRLVCNTARSWIKLPPKRLRDSWIVQYRIADFRATCPDFLDHPDVQCMLACDQLYGWNPRRHRDAPHKRRMWFPDRRQFWLSCITADYAVAFASMLYNRGLVQLLL